MPVWPSSPSKMVLSPDNYGLAGPGIENTNYYIFYSSVSLTPSRSPMLSPTFLLLLLSMSVLPGRVYSTPPAELFSPSLGQKVLRTAQTPPGPNKYPQYTDRAIGAWQYFAPDLWTTGFFPATLYAMHTRDQLCGVNKQLGADWLALARSWSLAEIPLETMTSVGHDVGFLSYPFMAELEVSVDILIQQNCVFDFGNFHTATRTTKLLSTRSINLHLN